MSKFGKELVQSATEALAIAQGQSAAARTFTFEGPDIASIRKRLGLSQDKFAERFGLPAATIRDWEQGRRHPEAAARLLLKVIDYAPETVERAINAR